MSKNRQKKLERRRKRVQKEKDRRKKQRNSMPKLRVCLSLPDYDHKLSNDVVHSLSKVEVTFWEELGQENRRICRDVKNKDCLLRNEQGFRNHLCDVMVRAFEICNPKYAGQCNYSFEVYSDKLFEFEVVASSLLRESTDGGTVHIIPHLVFPPNMRLGMSGHALERTSTRLFKNLTKPFGPILRLPMIVLPWNENIYALYFAFPKRKDWFEEGVELPMYGLMGYLPISIKDDLMIGVTLLEPGFVQTPERDVRESELEDYRLHTVQDGKVYRVIYDETAKDKQRFTKIEQENPLNPNLGMLVHADTVMRTRFAEDD